MRVLPQHRVQLPPDLAGDMMTGRKQIQGQRLQVIESLHVGGKNTPLQMTSWVFFAHQLSFKLVPDAISAGERSRRAV